MSSLSEDTYPEVAAVVLFRFQIKDEIKAARNEAMRRTFKYVEALKMSQRRLRLDLESETVWLK